jgi:steroid delta-isomerase-like uncharacterized protein
MQRDTQDLWKLDLEFWNSGNAELAAQVYASEAKHCEPGRAAVIGPREIVECVAELRTAFPDFRLEFTQIFTEGDQFVHRWTCTGTQRGEFMGVPATGVYIETRGVTVGRTEKGRIVVEELYYDRLGFLEQIGVAPGLAHAEK